MFTKVYFICWFCRQFRKDHGTILYSTIHHTQCIPFIILIASYIPKTRSAIEQQYAINNNCTWSSYRCFVVYSDIHHGKSPTHPQYMGRKSLSNSQLIPVWGGLTVDEVFSTCGCDQHIHINGEHMEICLE